MALGSHLPASRSQAQVSGSPHIFCRPFSHVFFKLTIVRAEPFGVEIQAAQSQAHVQLLSGTFLPHVSCFDPLIKMNSNNGALLLSQPILL
jgi:hypothetical protein